MPILSFDIPAAQSTRILNSVAQQNGYNPDIHGTKLEFLKSWTIQQWKNAVNNQECLQAQQLVKDQVETDIQIT